MTHANKKQLHDITFESILVPGGCTRYIQAPDVSWNKSISLGAMKKKTKIFTYFIVDLYKKDTIKKFLLH